MPPDLRALEREVRALGKHPRLARVIDGSGTVMLKELSLEDVDALLGVDEGALLLMATGAMSRTDVRTAITTGDVLLVAPPLRRAFVVQSKLPASASFEIMVELAIAKRRATLGRTENAATETLFRERLEFEGVPLRMSGAWTRGLLVARRKPDGVWPDPESGQAPRLYLEIKKINRVADDIQKRLYEIAEVSLEMKFLYGDLRLKGMALDNLLTPDAHPKALAALRRQVTRANPVVVALVLCPEEQLERARTYRARAEAFIDRLFLPDEIDKCIEFLAEKTTAA